METAPVIYDRNYTYIYIYIYVHVLIFNYLYIFYFNCKISVASRCQKLLLNILQFGLTKTSQSNTLATVLWGLPSEKLGCCKKTNQSNKIKIFNFQRGKKKKTKKK